ncbi:hypothetical protein Tco_0960382, partial [Tanacetum coccineum]
MFVLRISSSRVIGSRVRFDLGFAPRGAFGLRVSTKGEFGTAWQPLGCIGFCYNAVRPKGAAAATMGCVWWVAAVIGVRLAGTATQGVFGLLFRWTRAFGCGFNSRRGCLVHGSRKGVFRF